MCFMTKCPYVPPHAFNVDFPHLLLRYRAVDHAKGKTSFATRQVTETDRNGTLAALAAPLVNWAASERNPLTRPVMEKVVDIPRHAALPTYHRRTFRVRSPQQP